MSSDLSIGRTYWSTTDAKKTVKVTRLWTSDDGRDAVAFDILSDGRGNYHPGSHGSAMNVDLFNTLYGA